MSWKEWVRSECLASSVDWWPVAAARARTDAAMTALRKSLVNSPRILGIVNLPHFNADIFLWLYKSYHVAKLTFWAFIMFVDKLHQTYWLRCKKAWSEKKRRNNVYSFVNSPYCLLAAGAHKREPLMYISWYYVVFGRLCNKTLRSIDFCFPPNFYSPLEW